MPKTVFVYLVVQLAFIRSFSQQKTLLLNMPRLGTSPGTYGLAEEPNNKVAHECKCAKYSEIQSFWNPGCLERSSGVCEVGRVMTLGTYTDERMLRK